MNLYKDLPLYYISIDDAAGMEAIALVENPAVEVDFLKFDAEPKRVFSKDEERHIITGVAIMAGKPIYRYDPYDGEYYVVFTKDVIEQLVLKYAKDNFFNRVNLQHDEEAVQDGIYMVESYFVDKKRGIAPKEIEAEDGSWIVSYKVENEALWEEIKNSGELKGFSIEGYFNMCEEGFAEEEEDWLDQFLPKKKVNTQNP